MGRKLLIVVIILIIGLGAYLIYRSSSSSSSTSTASLTDKGLSLSLGSNSIDVQYIGDPAKINYGIGIYPGAKADSQKESSATAKINNATMTYGTFTTTAPTSNVLEFYKKQMGSQAQVSSMNNGEMSYTVVSIKGKQSPVVSVYTEDGQTKFTILK